MPLSGLCVPCSRRSRWALASSDNPSIASALTPRSAFSSPAIFARTANRPASVSPARYLTASSSRVVAGACAMAASVSSGTRGWLCWSMWRAVALVASVACGEFMRDRSTPSILPESMRAALSPSSWLRAATVMPRRRGDRTCEFSSSFNPSRDSVRFCSATARTAIWRTWSFSSLRAGAMSARTLAPRQSSAASRPIRWRGVVREFHSIFSVAARRDKPYCAACAVAGSGSSSAAVSSAVSCDSRRRAARSIASVGLSSVSGVAGWAKVSFQIRPLPFTE